MDRAQTRLLVALAVLVLAVAAVLYAQGPETELADPAATAIVWESGEAEVLSEVTLVRPSDSVHLSKGQDGWTVVEPAPSAPADEERVAALVRALSSLRRGIPVPAPADRAAEFGLGEPPEVRVTVRNEAGVERTVEVGIEAPVGYRTYVRGADGGIVAVSGDLHRLVTEDANGLRDHRAFRFLPADVREVSVVRPDRTVALTTEGTRWWIDGLGPADDTKVDDLVGSLLDLRFDTIAAVDGGGSDPVTIVEVMLADGTRQTLRTGLPDGDDVEAVTSDGRHGTLYAGVLRELGGADTDLAMRRAFDIRLETTDAITVTTSDGATVRAMRNGGGFTIDGLEDGLAYDAVAALAAAPVLGWLDAEVAPGPTMATVTVKTGDDVFTVTVGGSVAEGEVAASYGRGRPARISADAVPAFLAAAGQGGR